MTLRQKVHAALVHALYFIYLCSVFERHTVQNHERHQQTQSVSTDLKPSNTMNKAHNWWLNIHLNIH